MSKFIKFIYNNNVTYLNNSIYLQLKIHITVNLKLALWKKNPLYSIILNSTYKITV